MQVTVAKLTRFTGDSADVDVAPGNWSKTSVPAANAQATVTQVAGGAGVINVATTISASLVGGTSAPTAVNVNLNLINGASGGTSYLWQQTISLTATAGTGVYINLTGLSLPGSANTGMTLEFSAAGGSNTIESVTLAGYTVSS